MAYNGHKNWNYWNVSLWINNDEGLYRLALELIRCNTRPMAARLLVQELADRGIHKTPDGAAYTASAVRAALVGMT